MSILKQSQRLIVTAALGVTLLSGCMFGGAEAPTEAEPYSDAIVIRGEAAAPEAAKEGAAIAITVGEAAPDGEAAAAPAYEAEALATAMPSTSVDAARDSTAETDSFAPQQLSPLRAGEVDDNAQWDDYLLYRRGYSGPWVNEVDISERYVIDVTDGQGLPLLGANVSVALPAGPQQEIFSARTMANGRVLFHPLAAGLPLEQVNDFLVTVDYGSTSQQFALTRLNAQPATSFTDHWTVALDARPTQANALPLDVLFLVDATGSMADEIAKIQSTIFDVSAQIDALPGRPNVRYGLVTYRDRGDLYVTRVSDFTPDVRDFSRSLDMVQAGGGGDYPESLNEGLHHAIHNVAWRGGEAVKLIFLVADAPPHLDYEQDYDYAVEMDIAARQGIKIFPIASSGLDDQGEYIFRQLAQYTQGRFIFLTYADGSNGGDPGDVTTHHVDDYSVENLDQLLVRLVQEELAHQSRQLVQAQ
ncbi:MAG: hypothetical protein Kow0031_30270 [Anaerolineae bacterium]